MLKYHDQNCPHQNKCGRTVSILCFPQKFRVTLAIFPVSLRPSSCVSVDPKLACYDSTVFEYWIPIFHCGL